MFPHLDHEDLPDNSMADAEKWAAGMPVPAYAIDDQTAIKVIDGTVEVVSEGHWKLFTLRGGVVGSRLRCGRAGQLVWRSRCDLGLFEHERMRGDTDGAFMRRR